MGRVEFLEIERLIPSFSYREVFMTLGRTMERLSRSANGQVITCPDVTSEAFL
jgi:hypothetical protein